MVCRLFKVGEDIDHISFYDITESELILIKKAVSRVETGNHTKPSDRDIASKVSKAIRDCTVIEITEDTDIEI